VVNFDKLTYAGNLKNLSAIEYTQRYSFIKGDICNTKQLGRAFRQVMPDYVLNFAAESHVDRSILCPGVFGKSNVVGVQHLLDLSLKCSVKKYLQISTDEVYGSLFKVIKMSHFVTLLYPFIRLSRKLSLRTGNVNDEDRKKQI